MNLLINRIKYRRSTPTNETTRPKTQPRLPTGSTIDEFVQHDVSEIILDQCAIKQFHKLDGMNREWAEEFGLNHAQMRFVQDAIPGSDEKGYSQALVGVDGEWRGIEVRALPRETAVIENQTDSVRVDTTSKGSPTNADDD